MLAVDVEKRLGEFDARREIRDHGRRHRAVRRVGLRQDLDRQHDRRPGRRRTAAASRSTTRCCSTARRASNVPAHRRRIGYVFQEGRLFPHLTVAQNLDYGRWMSRPAARRGRARAHRRAARHRPSADAPARQALRRRAPARRVRPRAADEAAAAAARRAARLARPRAQARNPAVSGAAARRGQGADDLCQPPGRRDRGASRRRWCGSRTAACWRPAGWNCWMRGASMRRRPVFETCSRTAHRRMFPPAAHRLPDRRDRGDALSPRRGAPHRRRLRLCGAAAAGAAREAAGVGVHLRRRAERSSRSSPTWC